MHHSPGSEHSSPTRALAEFAAGLTYDRIPGPVVEHARLCLLDGLGCALYGARTPEARIVVETARDWSSKPESTLWAQGCKTAAPNAALANGTMMDSFTLDDSHRAANIHPSAATVPPAIAVAERAGGVDGRSFLAALVAGYEVGIRVGMSTCPSLQERGHHGAGSVAGFCAAAAAGKLLGLSAERMVHALGIVGSQGGGLMAGQYGSMVKRMHAGKAGQNGVFSALLAARGFTGIVDVLEAEYGGFCRTYSDRCDLGLITRGIGEQYETANIHFRRYSSSGAIMTAVDAVRDLLKRAPVPVDQVQEVVIGASAITVKHNGWRYSPATAITAQSNMPYGVAVALLEGDAFVDQYVEEKLRDPRVLALADRVRVVEDEEFTRMGPKGKHAVRVEIRLAGGGRLVNRLERARPVSPDEIVAKFRTLAGKTVDPARADRIIDLVDSLHALPDIAPLVEAIA